VTASAQWQALGEAFERRFGGAPELGVRAPGRVNLIGDHTDYHEGFVLPMAIERAIFFLARRREDRRIRVYSQTLSAGFEIGFDTQHRHAEGWARYFQGVLSALSGRHPLEVGADVLIDADLPPGGGLSSSSALVVGFAAIVARLHGLALDPLELARIGCDAEHWYGTTGGIMDQYVISHARARHAVLIDCRSLSHELIAMPGGVAVVIASTGTRHDQIASPFAQRRREAEAALSVVQARAPDVATLRDLDPDRHAQYRPDLMAAEPSGVLWRRSAHVVSENARVLESAAALAHGDLPRMGRLMAESHASLRDDYEVASPGLDAMVDAALASPGCLGARMTGGGFGGCTVNLVAVEQTAAFCSSLHDRYRRATGIEPTVFVSEPADGVQEVPDSWFRVPSSEFRVPGSESGFR